MGNVRIQAYKKLAQLRQILLVGAANNAQTVNDALLAFQTSVNEQNFQRGRQYSNTAGNGQSAGYQPVFAGAEWTQENVFAMSEEYFAVLTTALANNPALIDDGQKASTQAIFAAMACDDIFQGVTRRGLDSTLIGMPQVGYGL